jgi:diguanylate cyclase (GGDEF)-like protein/PAS domain S-box-containing protein
MTAGLAALGDLFDVLPDAVIIVDREGNIVLANRAIQRVFGYRPDELIGGPLDRLLPERHRAQHRLRVASFRAHGHATAMGSRPLLYALAKSGAEIPVSISIANFDLEGERYSVAVIRDASGVSDSLGEAIAQAETDALTGIGNRLHLSRCMRERIAGRQPFALLFIDLTRFKPFNDRHGHRVGDEVLRLVARRLQAMVRAHDVAARVGGDEFVLLLDGVEDRGPLARRAADIAATLEQPFRFDHITGSVGANFGGALFPADGRDEAELLQVADRRMYRAKKSRRAYCGEDE